MDALQEIRLQLQRLEARLATLERAAGIATSPPPTAPTSPTPTPTSAAAAAPRTVSAPARPAAPAKSASDDGNLAARWMAGGAAVAFLLAAVYLLRVVYDSGWLTPAREVALAALGGGALVVGGLLLARIDRAYAAWLPAAGSVILYVAAYGGHLYYELISRNAAIAAVAATSVLTLWLGRRFDSSIFVVFAVLGTYLFPLWLPTRGTPVDDLLVYFAAWSIAYAIFALQDARRLVYVLAMYCSLLGFQLVWMLAGNSGDWPQVVLFQLFQFVLFSVTAVAFSIMHRRAMDAVTAGAHGVALFYFYALEYTVLHANAPELAGLLALGSAVFVLLGYVVARGFLPAAQRGAGAVLVSSYCSVVTAHILFFEWLPAGLIPWAALLSPLLLVAATPLFRDTPGALWPVRIVSGFLFVTGFLAALMADDHAPTPLPDLVLFAYAGALYLGYLLLRDRSGSDAGTALLYAGHVSAMLAFSRVLDSGFTISVAWALLALALLVLAISTRDRNLGRSSLLVFAASGLKTLLVDLHGSDSLLRVLTLLVVGASLYAGGWLYQRIFRDPEPTNPAGTTAIDPPRTP